MAYIISYIPVTSAQRNEQLIDRIKRFEKWAVLGTSTFIVHQEGVTTITIRDELKQHISSQDKIFVAELSGNAAWRGFNEGMSQWLKDNL